MAKPARKNSTATKRRVITPECRAMFAFVHRPRAGMNEGDAPNYSINLVFKKSQDISNLRTAARIAKQDKWGTAPPARLRSPFRDGDTDMPDDPDFADKIFIVAKTFDKPGVLGRDREPLEDPNDFYSGCYCYARIIAYAYDKRGNKG